MHARAPLIDPRDTDDLVSTTEALLQEELSALAPGWEPATSAKPDLAYALVRIFARMTRYVVTSVNRIPDRALLEFFNLIGVAESPPTAARVPLTFTLAEGATSDLALPAGTRVSAPPTETQAEESVFETEEPVVVTRAALEAVIVHRPDQDLWADRTAPEGEPCPVTEADVPTPHYLFVDGGALFALPPGTSATVTLWLQDGASDGLPLAWAYWDGEAWQSFPADNPVTTIVDEDPVTNKHYQLVSFKLPEKLMPRVEGGREGRFLRAALSKEEGGELVPDTLVDDAVVPEVTEVEVGVTLNVTAGLAPDLAMSGVSPLDLNTEIYPFGDRPKAGDMLFLASEEVFSKPGADVTLLVERGEAAYTYSGPNDTSDDPVLVWEMWTPQGWQKVGRSTRTGQDSQNLDQTPGFDDGTRAFTQAGTVKLRVPMTTAPLELRGTTSHWLRVRIAKSAHGYGRGLLVNYSSSPITVTDEGHRPPVLAKLQMDYVYSQTLPAAGVVTYNDFTHADHTGPNGAPFKPFTHEEGAHALIYLGFDRPFDNRSVSLFFDVTPPAPAEISAEAQLQASSAAPPAFEWEYSSPEGWSPLDVEDDTQGLRRAAPVRFLGPADFTSRPALGRSSYWLRLRLVAGDFEVVPRLRCVLTSTVWARQAITITEEPLGSSDGQPGQVFRTSRAPVLSDPRMDVFEPVVPGPAEELSLRRISGDDAVRPALDEHGHATGAWVRWRQVPDFHASGPADRHYVLDHATGTVQFGGLGRGMAPPAGTGNIQATRYQVGGGTAGNRGPGEITTLLNTLPLVAGVTNHSAAAGGTDIETLDRVRERGPRLLRHGRRAVAAEDFEDLAREASPVVARTRAMTPGFEPVACAPGVPDPPAGHVLVVVVPYGKEAQPVPALSLLDDVRDYLQRHAAPAVRLRTSGPDWVRVTAKLEVAPESLDVADTLGAAVTAALEGYLHPITGGAAGEGWEFGTVPRETDLYPLLMRVPGVDHVRKLELEYERQALNEEWVAHPADSPGLTGPATLIFSGRHVVSIHEGET